MCALLRCGRWSDLEVLRADVRGQVRHVDGVPDDLLGRRRVLLRRLLSAGRLLSRLRLLQSQLLLLLLSLGLGGWAATHARRRGRAHRQRWCRGRRRRLRSVDRSGRIGADHGREVRRCEVRRRRLVERLSEARALGTQRTNDGHRPTRESTINNERHQPACPHCVPQRPITRPFALRCAVLPLPPSLSDCATACESGPCPPLHRFLLRGLACGSMVVRRDFCAVSWSHGGWLTLWYGATVARVLSRRTGPAAAPLAAPPPRPPPRPPRRAPPAVRSLLMIESRLWSSFDVMTAEGGRRKERGTAASAQTRASATKRTTSDAA